MLPNGDTKCSSQNSTDFSDINGAFCLQMFLGYGQEIKTSATYYNKDPLIKLI